MGDTSRKILGALTVSPELLETTEELSSALFYGRDRIVFESISAMWSESRPSTVDVMLLSEMVGGETPVTYITNLLKPNEIECVAKEKFLAMVNELVSRHHSLSRDVRLRIDYTVGDFTTQQLYGEFGATTVAEKDAIRQIMFRMKEAGEIVPVGKKDGVYRLVDNKLEAVDLLGPAPKAIDLYLPLGLDSLVKIYARSIIVCAGDTSFGKTSIAHDFIKGNMNKHDCHLFFCEGGVEGLQDRLRSHEDIDITDWKFKAYHRMEYFEDVVFPEAINVIDYMICPADKPWLMGPLMDAVYKKLTTGIAWINIQKGTGKDVGRGGDWSMERSQLYVTLSPNINADNSDPNVQYVVAKVLKNKAFINANPHGKSINFSIHRGWNIKHYNEWHYAHKQERQKKIWS